LGCPYGTWFEEVRRAWALASPGGICFFAADCGRTPGEAKESLLSKKCLVIPGLTRNPVRHSNFAARCAGENDSGFRVEPAMTKCWGFAGRRFWPRPAESAKNRNAARCAGKVAGRMIIRPYAAGRVSAHARRNRRPALSQESLSPFLCVSVSLWLVVLPFLRALRVLRG
jgi:hypothetical protein